MTDPINRQPSKKYQKQKSQHTRALLIAEARRLFQECGYEEVGIREISVAAGVTTGTFYYYFKDKNHILRAIYQRNDLIFAKRLAEMPGDWPACRKIVSFFADDMARQLQDDGKNFTRHRMFVTHLSSVPHTKLYGSVRHLVELAQQNGELDCESPAERITDFLFLVFRGAMYEWCCSEESWNLQEAFGEQISRALRAYQP